MNLGRQVRAFAAVALLLVLHVLATAEQGVVRTVAAALLAFTPVFLFALVAVFVALGRVVAAAEVGRRDDRARPALFQLPPPVSNL